MQDRWPSTYRTIAQRVGIDKIEARLLLDHTVPGIDGVYIHEKALFDKLLSAQERMRHELVRLCEKGAGSRLTRIGSVAEYQPAAGTGLSRHRQGQHERVRRC